MIQGMKFVSSAKGPTLRSKGPAKYVAKTEKLDITVPAGVTPGQQLAVTHNGQKVLVAVPEGVPPGGQFAVNVPGSGRTKTKKGSWHGMMNGRVLTVDGTSARPYSGDALAEYLRANADRDRTLTVMRKADKKLADEAETEAGANRMRKETAVSKGYEEVNFCSSKDRSDTFNDLWGRRGFSKYFIDEVFASLIAPFKSECWWFKGVLLLEGAVFSMATTLPITAVGMTASGLGVSLFFVAVILYYRPYKETDKTEDDGDQSTWRRLMNRLESNKVVRTDLITRVGTVLNLMFGAIIVNVYQETEEAKDAAFKAIQSLVFVDILLAIGWYAFALDMKSWFKKTYAFVVDSCTKAEVRMWLEKYIMEKLDTEYLERRLTKLHVVYTTTKQNTLLAKYHKKAFIGGEMKISPRDLGFLAVELKRAGYSVADCEKAGWSLRNTAALVNIRKVSALSLVRARARTCRL